MTSLGPIGQVVGSGQTPAITVTQAVPAGAVVVVGGATGTALTAATVTDSRGNTYATTVAAQGGATQGTRSYQAVSVLTTALAVGDTITITLNTSISNQVHVAAAWTGLAATPVDKSGITASGELTTSASPGATGVLAQADEILVVMLGLTQGTPVTGVTMTGWTPVGDISTTAGSNDKRVMLWERTVADTASTTPTATFDTASNWGAALVSIRLAPPEEPPDEEPPPAATAAPTRRWQVLAGDGTPDVELTNARDRKVTFRLSDPSDFSFTIDARHPQAGHLHGLVTDVHLVRDGVVLYTGRAGGSKDGIDNAAHTVQVATADYRALLGRAMWHDAPTDWADEQTAIVRALIDHGQSFPGGDLGIDTSKVTPFGVYVPRKTETGARILAEIQALAAGGTSGIITPGFDWDITPGWTARTLQVWPVRGTDRGVVLTYRYTGQPESSIVAKLDRQIDPATYANAIQVSGSDELVPVPGTGVSGYYDMWGNWVPPGPPDMAPTTRPIWRVVDDIATRPEGRWETQLSFPDITSQTALEYRADAELARLDTITPTYAVTLKQGAWHGPEHIWLGDPIRLVVNSGRLVDDTTLRVTEIAVTIGESGEEDVALTLGPPPSTLLSRLRATERQLAVSTRWRQAP